MDAHSEDEDLKRAIALSLAGQRSDAVDAEHDANADAVFSNATNGRIPESSNTQLSGLLGLDRKAMEQERLARRALKRERSITPPSVSNARKAPKLAENTVTFESGAKLRSFSTIVQGDQRDRKSAIANAANAQLKSPTVKPEPSTDAQDRSDSLPAVPSGGLQYPRGIVKKTWVFGHERTGNDVKIEEVLEPSTLKTAVLSAFQWDVNWVLSKLKNSSSGIRTKCVFIMQAKEEALRKQMLEETEDSRHYLRLCFPPMDGLIFCMHSKLMLLFHLDKLRIAIPTANLLNFDWGETGVMENSVFMIDLPRLAGEGNVSVEELTPFGQDLMYYISKQGLDEDVRDGLLNFDFSATSDLAFVHTVGGMSYRDGAERTGLPGLGRAVRQLGLETDDLELDFAASSVGALNEGYLRNLYTAARGEDMIAQARSAESKAKADFFKKLAEKDPPSAVNVHEKLRIYFPTHETVRASTAGICGTVCISRDYWEASTFPRSCFRDYQSKRPGVLSHNKLLYARGRSKGRDVAWVYVGSANVSKSAWGELVHDKKYKDWKVTGRNWECGVLMPVPNERLQQSTKEEIKVKSEHVEGDDSETEVEEDADDSEARPLVGMGVFERLFDIPFQHPGARYGNRHPWYFKESD